MDDIIAVDLLRAMIRRAPSDTASEAMTMVLCGYLDAYEGRVAPDELADKPEPYRRGYALCTRYPITVGERMGEILALQETLACVGIEISKKLQLS